MQVCQRGAETSLKELPVAQTVILWALNKINIE